MSTNNSCNDTTETTNCGVNYIILIVLYILLAIILGSYWY